MDIVITKHIGMSGALELVRGNRESVEKKFYRQITDSVLAYESLLDTRQEEKIAGQYGKYVFPMGKGGVIRVLNQVWIELRKGFQVDLKALPIRQETIEVFQLFDKNPYEEDSRGSLLILTDQTGSLMGRLKEGGIDAALVGYITDNKDKILRTGDRISFLNRSKKCL